MTTPVVELRNVGKRYGEVTALSGVSFTLGPGEVLSLLGPSGCGKTTVLRLIAGFETPDEGEVSLRGSLVAAGTLHVAPERRRVGMLFQEYALFPHLTVEENVAFGLHRLHSDERRPMLSRAMALVRLEGLEARYPHELSGGQQQRVALARTLAPQPVVILLDEPFSNVDASLRAQLRAEVESILREGRISAVFVTHDREEAFATADRVAVMHDGRIEQIDTPQAVYHTPSSPEVARICGSANFIDGVIESGWAATEVGRLQWSTTDDSVDEGSHVWVLVHPDDFRVQYSAEGRAKVVSSEFRGDETILRILLPSGKLIHTRNASSGALLPGTPVRLTPAARTPFTTFLRDG